MPATAEVGLRARKAARNRAALIDAAVRLCVRHGYAATTVDRIAEATEMSPRTVSRYFPTKDAVLLAVLDELCDDIAATLRRLPPSMTIFAAMGDATLHVLECAIQRHDPVTGVTAERVQDVVTVITSSPELRTGAVGYRHPAVMAVAAHRMGLDVDHPHVELLMELTAVTLLHATTAAAVAAVTTASHKPDLSELALEMQRSFTATATLTTLN